MIAIIVRTVVFYIVVTFAIRIMGKRQVGDMQPNELVVTLLISEIAAIPLQDTDQPILSGMVAIFSLVFLEIIVSVLAMKFFSMRKLMSGRSVVIIKNGVIDQHAMRDVRMTVLDLVELLRQQNVFDISEVAFAVLEVSGALSVMLKADSKPLTGSDVGINCKEKGLSLPVITDGRIINESLSALEISINQLNKALKKRGVSAKEIFLMTADRYGNIDIIKERK